MKKYNVTLELIKRVTVIDVEASTVDEAEKKISFELMHNGIEKLCPNIHEDRIYDSIKISQIYEGNNSGSDINNGGISGSISTI